MNDKREVHSIKAGVMNPANLLTMLRILLVPLYLWLFAEGSWITSVLALIVFVTAAITDLYDGKLARKRKEVTKLGKFMDPLADKILVIGALVQFWFMGLVNFWLVGVIIVRDIWVTIMRVRAIISGTELKTSGDAKLKTTIQLTVIITIIVFYGARIIALHLGYSGPWISISGFRTFFDVLVGIAVVFTLYSWIKYLFAGNPAKA
ncbi:CDP-diacylglycerol--glycerol-3-phosphate 3-phosphatidyltransferase [bacterium]|nr:CDP-diacylglycerol--glycerol-3-phosphate 3-phosphatidyltransferase [bacterium]